jgi:asparagine synthetase B (glutamine-hydrolysing)
MLGTHRDARAVQQQHLLNCYWLTLTSDTTAMNELVSGRGCRSFAAKDEVFCLFEGVLDNLGRLSQQYGLSKGANEVLLVIEAYKALRDRAPYPASFMLSQLAGTYAFVLFDKATSSLLVASDPDGKVPLYWGITADGCVAFSDDIDMLKGSCGKSLAPFPQGTVYVVRNARSYLDFS